MPLGVLMHHACGQTGQPRFSWRLVSLAHRKTCPNRHSGCFRIRNRQKAYTKAEANTAAINGATKLYANDTNYNLATEEEQRVMFRTKVAELTEMYMAGYGNDDGQPNAGRLSEGVATPVTNEPSTSGTPMSFNALRKIVPKGVIQSSVN